MTYLELCVRARQEAGITGAGPTTVIDQTGQLLKLVSWVDQAWQDIQIMKPNWLFMNEAFEFDTVAATRDYLASAVSIADMKLWDVDSFLIYEKALDESDQNELPYLTYQEWRPAYRARMGARDDARPQAFTILPNNALRFEPRPDDAYTVEGEYKRSTQVFTADADEPTGFPDDFHLMIVWQALKLYGHYEDAPEVLDEAETQFDNLLLRLLNEQLPTMSEDYESLA